MKRNRWLKLLFSATVTVVVVYAVATHLDKIRTNVSERDSIQYWAAGKLLIQGHNPYDVESTIELEWQHGYAQDRPVLFRTPSWSLFLFLPWVECFWGWLLWMAVSVASLILAMRLS